jgi:hypothetical protein
MNDSDLDQFVLLESFSVSGGVTLDPDDSIEDVSEAFFPISHMGIASRSTRSRIRGLIPRALRAYPSRLF